MMYYRLNMDMGLVESWVLDYMQEKEEQKYAYPNRIINPPNSLSQIISPKGKLTDFTLNPRTTIIGTDRFASLFSEKEVQLIPVQFPGLKTDEPYYAIVVLNELECVDENTSEYQIWEEGNSIRPDLAGRFKSFFKIRINNSFHTELNIFRIKRYKIAIVVSEEIKRKVNSMGLSGMIFTPLK